MENSDLGSKKINNKEEMAHNQTPDAAESLMHSEVEADQNGKKKIVQRARSFEKYLSLPDLDTLTIVGAEATIIPEVIIKKMVENRDKNSDIKSNRYPNSHPDNHENRGNL